LGAKKIDKIVDDYMKGHITESEFKNELESTDDMDEDLTSVDMTESLEEAKELIRDIDKSNKRLKAI
jgi:hypothetical protein